MRSLFIFLLLSLTNLAYADVYFMSKMGMNQVEAYHSTVGVAAQAIIPTGSIKADIQGFSVCVDAEATATYFAIGKAVDPLTDGVRIGAGQCFVCSSCTSKILRVLRGVAQAANTGYSVIQFRQ